MISENYGHGLGLPRAWRQRSKITNKRSLGAGRVILVLGMKPVSQPIYSLSHFDDILTITLRMVVIFTHQDAALLPRQLLPEAKNFYLPFIGLRNLLMQRSCLRDWTDSKNLCPKAPRNIDGSSDAHFFCRHPLQLNQFLHITICTDSYSNVWLSLIVFLV